MPYPESCPECGGTFRNTGTHFTARRNEVGRHVLLELGCQNTNRRYWWDFTAAQLALDENRPAPALAAVSTGGRATSASATNGVNGAHDSNGSNGSVAPSSTAVLEARPATGLE